MTKKALVLGGTGAIGVYLVPELLACGFSVDVTTRDKREPEAKKLKFVQGNAHDPKFLRNLLHSNKYDVIVDFMNYATDEFGERVSLLLKNCKHYIFLSSYRVFADTETITEKSPRLLDVSTDKDYLKTDDYALAKARQEDILRSASEKNWTIVRPAITYSRARFQLGTMEADMAIWRTLQNLPVVLPRSMLDKTTTMTWAGDVARLMAKLALNKEAFGEDFNISTAEHHTWAEVAKMYGEIVGLKVKPVGLNEYVAAMGGGFSKYQVGYDRMFDRILDNSKILHATGEKQKDFTKLKVGLRRELIKFVKDPHFSEVDYVRQARFDRLTGARTSLEYATPHQRQAYQEAFSPIKTRLKQNLRPRTRLRAAKSRLRPRTRIKGLAGRARSLYVRQKHRHADGAILTLVGYYNYGNILQRYALQEFLRQKGFRFVSYTGSPRQSGPDFNGPNFSRVLKTKRFVEERIWSKSFDTDDKLSTYIVGSDQVWRNWGYANEAEDLGYYFLGFVRDSQAKRIAYAASFGQDNLGDAMISNDFVKHARPLIKKFDAISVREASGVEILRKTWRVEARHVLDPTMLLAVGDYNKLITKPTFKLTPTRPIFAYILADSDEKTRMIQKIASDTGREYHILNAYKDKALPAVEQWLKNFRDSGFVITDSFHGMAFAIINNTPFVVVENKGGGVTRMKSLLGQFGLEDRLTVEDKGGVFDVRKLKPIDWREVNRRLAVLREESSSWLLDSLQGR